MKISNKTHYGLRFLLNLAVSYGQQLTLNEIAEKEGISEKFLESIASSIKSKGLVSVKRGAKGGYELSKLPSQITVREIFEALEGDFFNNELSSELKIDSTAVNQTVNKMILDFHLSMRSYLNSITLESLLTEYHNLNSEQMFYI